MTFVIDVARLFAKLNRVRQVKLRTPDRAHTQTRSARAYKLRMRA